MRRQVRTIVAALLLAAPAASSVSSVSAQGSRPEAPPTLRATDALPPTLRQGPHHSVGDRVVNDGLLNRYEMATAYGTFEVEGTELLRKRVEELAALDAMGRLDVPSEFLKSAGSAATAPLRGAVRLLTKPAQTVRETAQGAGRVLGRVGGALTPTTDDNPDGPFAAISGFSAAKRRIAVDFGVDPYSRFAPLQERLVALARASAAGSLTVRGALMAVPGGVGIGIGVGSGIDNAANLLRDKTPAELNDINRASLRAMGVDEATISAFLASPVLSPSDKTIVVESLRQVGGAAGRGLYVAHATHASDHASAYFARRRAELIARFHRDVEPVAEFVDPGDVPVMRTRSGRLVTLLPVDYLAWTSGGAAALDAIARVAPRGPGRPAPELWLTGKVSPRAADELRRRGWHVRQDVRL